MAQISAQPNHMSIYSSSAMTFAVCELCAAAIALLMILQAKTNSCVR